MTDFKKILKKVERATTAIEDVVFDLSHEIVKLSTENERLQSQRGPVELPESRTPISAEGLLSLGLVWHQEHLAFLGNRNRLSFWVREDGKWWATFDSTHGGYVGSYRILESIEEIQTLMALFGVRKEAQ